MYVQVIKNKKEYLNKYTLFGCKYYEIHTFKNKSFYHLPKEMYWIDT